MATSVLSDEDWSCSTRAQVVQEPEKKFAAMFAGQCLPMGSDGVSASAGEQNEGAAQAPRLFSPLLYQLSYLARPRR